jgi:hypothetical protein
LNWRGNPSELQAEQGRATVEPAGAYREYQDPADLRRLDEVSVLATV